MASESLEEVISGTATRHAVWSRCDVDVEIDRDVDEPLSTPTSTSTTHCEAPCCCHDNVDIHVDMHAVGCLAWRLVAMQGLAWHQACHARPLHGSRHARPLHGSQAQMLMLLELLLELLLLLLLYVLIT